MSTPNNSASGGVLTPNPKVPYLNTVPANLTFVQFIQQMLTGFSAFEGTLVRPNWQPFPPKQPEPTVNWLAFGIESIEPDFNAYVGQDSNDNPFLQRNETLALVLSIYGPNSYDNVGLIRDAFQITQNLNSLKSAKVGFAYDTQAQHVPELFNEIWYDRWRVTFYMRRQIQRTYPILTFMSATGIVYSQTAKDPNYQQTFTSEGS